MVMKPPKGCEWCVDCSNEILGNSVVHSVDLSELADTEIFPHGIQGPEKRGARSFGMD